ncbi:MAG: PP2C family protein-serine/threonine phosphatase [Leptospirales bacterium]|jgi:serine phosphatase RsbU (regulator of sigma subunit)
MRWQQLIYPLAFLALGALYVVGFESEGYRLPRYYSPAGSIMPLGYESTARRFLNIDGQDPAIQGPIFAKPDSVFVTTDRGAGIMRLTPNSIWKIVFDFKFFILFSFVYLVCAVWFLQSANDIHLAAVCGLLSMFNFSLVMVMAFHSFGLVYQISGLMLTPALINMGLRTTGKEVVGYLLAAELIAVLFLALIAVVSNESAESVNNLARVTLGTFLLALLFVVGLQLENALIATDDRVERLKRWMLVAGTIFGFLLPFVLVVLELRGAAPPIPIEYVMGLGLLFPLSLIYGTYRLQIVPFQFVLTHSIVAGLLTILLVGVYGAVLLAHSTLLPEQNESYQWIVSLIFVLILVFFLDPARRVIVRFVDRRIFRLDTKLTESLKHLAEMISTHGRLQPAANAFLNEVQNTLRLEKVSFLLSAPSFAEFNLRQQKLHRLSEKSIVWRYLTPERLIVTAYLTYAAGRREEVFNYLYKNKFVLAIGILGKGGRRLGRMLSGSEDDRAFRKAGGSTGEEAQAEEDSIRAALLVGYRRNGTKLELREIRYLQEAAKLAGMLIYNYALLLQEVRKRRRIRDVVMAGQVQRTISGPDIERYPVIRMAYLDEPAISVSGDYLDLIPVSRSSFAFFLGDVSGHGLGTGYIASSLRAMTRAHLESGAGLLDTIQMMNTFLVDRYRGNEYITLFAFTLNTDTGEMDYVNAGHPGPFLYRRGDEAIRLQSNLHMVGILPTPFNSIRIQLSEGDRLFLFSDGVTETFNAHDEAFGTKRLQDFLDASRTTPVEYIPAQLKDNLAEYRGKRSLTDDSSFVVMEFHRRGGPLRGLLQFLGLGGENAEELKSSRPNPNQPEGR